MAEVRHKTERAAREARDSPAVSAAARAGMAAYGAVYILIGWLAGQLALGESGRSASGTGALRQVREQPMGAVVLWLAAAGLAGLVVWEVCQAIGGHRDEEGLRRWAARAASVARGAVFGLLAFLSIRVASGQARGSSGGVTGRLMAQPFGPALVVLVGLGVAGLGVYSIVHGVTDRWRRGLEAQGKAGALGRVVKVLARTGYVSRGVAFLVIAGMFVWSAITHDPEKSGGLDQAIVRFRDEPYGPWLMLVVAAGLACYGAFHVVRGYFLRGT